MTDLFKQQNAAHRVMEILSQAVPDEELVRAFLPEGWTPRDGPRIIVQSDGTPTSSKGWTREFVRVFCQTGDIYSARQLMERIDALLTTPGIHRLGCPISASTGIITIPDSKLGGFVSSATYSVALPRKVF